jgi:hypothetical protein
MSVFQKRWLVEELVIFFFFAAWPTSLSTMSHHLTFFFPRKDAKHKKKWKAA